jgi:hypothetical protein
MCEVLFGSSHDLRRINTFAMLLFVLSFGFEGTIDMYMLSSFVKSRALVLQRIIRYDGSC